MKKLFNLLLAMLAIVGVACTPDNNNNDGGGDAPSLTFVVDITDITTTGATVSVTPSDDNNTYYFDVIEKAVLDEYKREAQFVEDYVADIKAYIEEYNACGYNLSFANFVSLGKDSYTYGTESALDPDTEYYAFAFGLTENGEITSGLSKVEFKTLSVDDNTGGGEATTSSNTAVLEVADITASGAGVRAYLGKKVGHILSTK